MVSAESKPTPCDVPPKPRVDHRASSKKAEALNGLSNRWLITILRAAHCRSTHHFFAVDALPLVTSPAGQRFANHLLRHHDRYLTGAKDPDTRFRDFHNHVIHVDDGYWGGAPRVAHQWYDRLQRYLRDDRWSDAAHAAGVLSHYFTDPIQPLHTAQTDKERILHRPIEWSITQSYRSLFSQWQNDSARIVFQLSDRPGWLGEAILQSARVSHQHYDTLLDHYDLKAGRSDPPAGLDGVSRGCLSQLIGLCVTGWARVIERAAMDAEQTRRRPIPDTTTTFSAVMAGIRIPSRVWLRRIEHAIEQRKVAGLIDEYEATGAITRFLPSEVRVVEKVRNVRRHEREYAEQLIHRSDPSPVQILSQHESFSHQQSSTIPLPVAAPHVRLTLIDPLVDAPSIGPKTAKRFADIGILTVGDFLRESPESIVIRLATRWITASTIHQWRCQAILMCQLPNMLVRETQLLVGAGYTTADKIAKSNVETIASAVQAYAETHSGLRQLRGASPPDRDRIDEWIGDASLTLVRQKRAIARDVAWDARSGTESPTSDVRVA